MDILKGLNEYVKTEHFRSVMGIPAGSEIILKPLARGEYNINYTFTHPEDKRTLVLRANTGSQMHLDDQIGYEYGALKLLEGCGRTPKAYFVDGTRDKLGYGIMVMEFLPGKALDYNTELNLAAPILADIHSVELRPDCGLIMPAEAGGAILDECDQMIEKFYQSPLGQPHTKKKIEEMMKKGRRILADTNLYTGLRCCINTELNSGNFLINGPDKKNYLVDWEKPLYADPAQDLGHFLTPTTTFWKTDVILTRDQRREFVHEYIRAVDGRYDTAGLEERVNTFIRLNCLRGITWCAMAWVEYNEPGRAIKNDFTFRKISAYIQDDFLDNIDRNFLG